ncbi:MAG: hypothetical protein H7267_13035, partial [Sandarakinorhabdus sp.]|nr:hypothetical protein [Sandarakinorhabdus sp.]
AKAATRLRRAGRTAGWLGLAVKAEAPRGERPPRWSAGMRVPHVADTVTLLYGLDALWTQMLADFAPRRFLQVSIVLAELGDASAIQPELFGASLAPADAARRLALSVAMDKLNARFGRDAVTLGHDAAGAARSHGPRIAFTRVPDLAEFHK